MGWRPDEGKHHREVGVGCYDNALTSLRDLDDLGIGRGELVDVGDVDNVMTRLAERRYQLGREVGVNQKPHAGLTAVTSRSLTTAAAYSRAARMSSGSRYG